jgi:sugar/nucleoside kinase (ribokinase family)
MSTNSLSKETSALLSSDITIQNSKTLAGFDGFIDTICDVVETRRNAREYTRISTLKAYGERIAAAAGKSTNVEIVPTLVKLGGNGPIMANALGALGLPVTYCGMTGYPNTNPVFEEFGQRSKLLPICEPALTDAYEFDDGKLIVGKHATVAEVTYENLLAHIGKEAWCTAWEEAGFIAMVNWTMLPYMTDIWREVLAEFTDSNSRKTIFFDLADPEKRSREDILEALGIISQFQKLHDVVLGLNEKEAMQVGDVLDLPTPAGHVLTHETGKELSAAIRARLGISVVVVHPTRFAAAASATETAAVEGPWTATPKISTGAGDHFNAGFCYGQLLGATIAQCLQMGVGTSGFYVRNAKSPSRAELGEFIGSL